MKEEKIKLPKGSVIVETGGLKSSKESFTREDLYQGIEETFFCASRKYY